jgi:prevent-host-death family protein
MVTVGAFEAKTHLSALLERVAQGESFTITKHGKPVAMLAPVPNADQARRQQAIEALKTSNRGRMLDPGHCGPRALAHRTG